MKHIKAGMWLVAFGLIIYTLAQLNIPVGGTGKAFDILDELSFVDDVGNVISLKTKPSRIVSLSPPTHTENIYTLKGEGLLYGVGKDSIFPYQVLNKKSYDISKIRDIEKLIDAQPDLVLVDPLMNKVNNIQISQLEVAGITVVSLMPQSYGEFESYIRRLAMVIDKEDVAEAKLEEFYDQMKALDNDASKEVLKDLGVYVESGQAGYLTPTQESIVGHALKVAGLTSIAGQTPKIYAKDTQYPLGKTFIENAQDEIDIIFSIKGQGYTGSDIASIKQNPIMPRQRLLKRITYMNYQVPCLASIPLDFHKVLKNYKDSA